MKRSAALLRAKAEAADIRQAADRLRAIDLELIGVCTSSAPGCRSALTLHAQDALAKLQRELRAFRLELDAQISRRYCPTIWSGPS